MKKESNSPPKKIKLLHRHNPNKPIGSFKRNILRDYLVTYSLPSLTKELKAGYNPIRKMIGKRPRGEKT